MAGLPTYNSGGVLDYKPNADQNDIIGGDINIGEMCPPGNINNGMRQQMADISYYVKSHRKTYSDENGNPVDVNLYISPSGSDSAGDGSQQRPFATPGRALFVAGESMDCRGRGLMINIMQGTYSPFTLGQLNSCGQRRTHLLATNGLVEFSTKAGVNSQALVVESMPVTMYGNFVFTNIENTNYDCLAINKFVDLHVHNSNITFNLHNHSAFTASEFCYLNYTNCTLNINGNNKANEFNVIYSNASNIYMWDGTCNATNIKAINSAAFINSDRNSFVSWTCTQNKSGCTGRRYTCTAGGKIMTNGRGENYLPGDIQGFVDVSATDCRYT